MTNNARRLRALYDRRKALGQCPRCSGPWKHERPVTCDHCRAEMNGYNEARRAALPTPSLAREPQEHVPGCAVCGLRGDHECLRGDATSRRHGWSYPGSPI